MSDTYIPGVKSKYDTEKLIEDLMKLERVRKTSAEKRIETLEAEKTVWQDVGRRISSLRDGARSLYSYQNPFNERIAISSDENALSARATREAVEAEYAFTIERPATADRFLSKPLPTNFQVPAGDYGFSVGVDKTEFTFRGGSLREFTEALNRRGKDKLRASTLIVQPGTQSLVLEGLTTGSDNYLGFSGATEAFVLSIGMAERIDDSERRFAVDPASLRPIGATIRQGVETADGILRVPAENGVRLALGQTIPNANKLILEMEIRTIQHPYDIPVDLGPPSGPSFPATGSISFGGIVIQSDPPTVPLPAWQAPEAPRRIDDPAPLSLVASDGRTTPLPAVKDSADFMKLRFNLADYPELTDLAQLQVKNGNTHRDYELRNFRVFDPDTRGNFKALHPITVASDAAFTMDGIELIRKSNTVDDLIPGVSVMLNGKTDSHINLEIQPDRETAKAAVIALVGNYNRLIGEINVLTRQEPQIVQELTYLDDGEHEAMMEKLGTMVGDSTLNYLKSALQRIAGGVYTTRIDRELSLLAHLGISSDSRPIGSGAGVDTSRLRGYLEIDEKKLDQVLEDNIEAVKDMFGNDTDGDLIVDSGIGYLLDNAMKPYIETGGILSLKTTTVDSGITREKRTVESEEKRLIAKETELKRKYGLMESALSRMESSSSSIDNFMKQNNNN